MTAVLVESFFVDNTTDKQIGDTKEEQRAFGVAYAKAILEFLGITYEPDGLYRVQLGAYSDRSNAESMKKKLQKAGFEAVIVKE